MTIAELMTKDLDIIAGGKSGLTVLDGPVSGFLWPNESGYQVRIAREGEGGYKTFAVHDWTEPIDGSIDATHKNVIAGILARAFHSFGLRYVA